jgi:hypothetical protein
MENWGTAGYYCFCCCSAVRLCLDGTPVANMPTVHPPDGIWTNIKLRWNDTDRVKLKNMKNCCSATSSTRNATGLTWVMNVNKWNGQEPEPRGEKLATNHLGYGMADNIMPLTKGQETKQRKKSQGHKLLKYLCFVLLRFLSQYHLWKRS